MSQDIYGSIVRAFDVHADNAVREVFAMMLDSQCTVESGPQASVERDTQAALIRLGGTIDGFCALWADESSRYAIARLLTGEEELDEETVKDSLGELCNMLAGAWKRGIPDLAANCTLSPPDIVSKDIYSIRDRSCALRLARRYRCCNAGFTFAMHCNVKGESGVSTR